MITRVVKIGKTPSGLGTLMGIGVRNSCQSLIETDELFFIYFPKGLLKLQFTFFTLEDDSSKGQQPYL
ncbi:hypothetical protein DLK05_02680 [Ancylomarina longa]|uniref:Uncharacterized protein n=1 Tax=Ancylomarina longa TaxID=2487017 RepID=A0A434AYP3_9BACT|nr:hypothetical protein DLK05_02680 [Ancylomarina longa]